MKCSKCGKENDGMFCKFCGAKLDQKSESSGWSCSKCGYRNSESRPTCLSCGEPRYSGKSRKRKISKSSSEFVFPTKAVVVVACIICFVVVPLYKGIYGDSNNVPASSPQVQTAYTIAGAADWDNAETVTTKTAVKSSVASKSTPAAMVSDIKGIDISDCNEIKSTDDGKYMLNVTIKGPDNLLTNSMTVRAMHNDIEAILEHMQSCTNLETINIFVEGTFYNAYGEESTDTAMRVTMNYSTLSKINFDGEYWDSSNIPSVADSYWVHSSLQ